MTKCNFNISLFTENQVFFKAVVDELVTVWKDKVSFKGSCVSLPQFAKDQSYVSSQQKGRNYLYLRPEFAGSADGQPSPGTDQENQEPGASQPSVPSEVEGATAKVTI